MLSAPSALRKGLRFFNRLLPSNIDESLANVQLFCYCHDMLSVPWRWTSWFRTCWLWRCVLWHVFTLVLEEPFVYFMLQGGECGCSSFLRKFGKYKNLNGVSSEIDLITRLILWMLSFPSLLFFVGKQKWKLRDWEQNKLRNFALSFCSISFISLAFPKCCNRLYGGYNFSSYLFLRDWKLVSHFSERLRLFGNKILKIISVPKSSKVMDLFPCIIQDFRIKCDLLSYRIPVRKVVCSTQWFRDSPKCGNISDRFCLTG